jgi:hypothetical protein
MAQATNGKKTQFFSQFFWQNPKPKNSQQSMLFIYLGCLSAFM